MRKGWYICRSEDSDYHRVKIVTDYNMASTSWLRRCSFALRPLAANEDPLMNCLGRRPPPTPHQKPGISATPTSPPPGTNKTIPTTHSTNATTPTTPPKEEGEKIPSFFMFSTKLSSICFKYRSFRRRALKTIPCCFDHIPIFHYILEELKWTKG